MRRLQQFSGTRHATRLDRFEFARAVFVRNLSSESAKRGIDRFLLPVVGMIVFSVRVRLPDFYQRVRDAFAIAVKHRTQKFQALAFCVRRRNGPHAIRIGHRNGKIRPDGAPGSRLEHAPGFTSCAQRACSPFRARRCQTGIPATSPAPCDSSRTAKSFVVALAHPGRN